MSAAFDAYVRWLERRAWFRWLVTRAEAVDARGRMAGWW